MTAVPGSEASEALLQAEVVALILLEFRELTPRVHTHYNMRA